MRWYYAESGNKVGPISEIDMERLASNGTIKSDTLVWSEGMAGWQSYKEVNKELFKDKSPETEDIDLTSESTCCECGRVFIKNDMIRHGESWVCAECKPVFVQKLQEGLTLSGEMNYGGFWIRFGAKFIDNILLSVVNSLIGAIFGFFFAMFMEYENIGASIILGLLSYCFGLAITITYNTWLIGKYGATLGKMACGLKVVTPDGGKVNYKRACGRAFAEILSGLILSIGYIMAAFDDQKRTLHDHICNTRVIRK